MTHDEAAVQRVEGLGNVLLAPHAADDTTKSEQSVDLRVLVDRVIVEAFAAGGRATLTGREFGGEGEAAVHLLAAGGQPTQVASSSVWSMACGWA